MRKYQALLISFLLLFFLSPKIAKAQSAFNVDSNLNYFVDESGTAWVNQKITLTNELAEVYAKSYTLSLVNLRPQEVKAESENQELTVAREEGDNLTKIKVEFPDEKVGKGAVREFKISYKITDFAQKIGQVWELSLPKLGEEALGFKSYLVTLSLPAEFGDLAYSSAEPIGKYSDSSRLILEFEKEQFSNSGVNLGFGDFQIFSFTLNYHLENPLAQTAKMEIALPPDGFFQKVFYKKIDPQPLQIRIDNDGNWLATFLLSPRQKTEVKAEGYAQIFPAPQKFIQPSRDNLEKNTLSQPYWESNDPEIKQIAQNLKTIKEVYDFVVKTLNYDYGRIKPNNQRLGAKNALLNPSSAVCTEFTDLFIAILRAKGIPAREINGYALTEDKNLMPLSLVGDILHAWPEYWDEKRKLWIPVDPTWQSTAKGADFFEKQDLRHFAFVIHGENSTSPLTPGSYKFGPLPQKDVFVTLGGKPEFINNQVKLGIQLITKIPLISYQAKFTLKNEGQSAIYNNQAMVYFDQQPAIQKEITGLLPFSSTEFTVNIPFSFWGKKTPTQISLNFLNQQKEIKAVKSQVLLANILIFFLIAILILIPIALKLGRVNLRFGNRGRNQNSGKM